jgi:hypothetical protein
MNKTDIIVNITYDICVEILFIIADITGFTYREVNVILFCIVLPTAFVIMTLIIFYQWCRIYKLSRK